MDQFLHYFDPSTTRKKLVETIGRSQTNDVLYRLERAGYVKSNGDGTWTLTHTGEIAWAKYVGLKR
jgi:Mn-dependent DtxR family transcriptional regulator